MHNKVIGPSLSVILCVHRSNPWLHKAVESVLMQSDGDFEFLIGANSCSDAFWEELQLLGQRDHRIHLIRTSIGQLAFNLNVLADRARGEYLVRMDADDICDRQRIATLRAHLACTPLDILGSSVLLINETDKIIGKMDFPLTQTEIVRKLKRRTVFCHPATVIRRQFLLDMRGYLGGYHSEDTDLWLRALRANARMGNVPQTLLLYRIHKEQATGTKAGYAEVCSHWLREFLTRPSLYMFEGLCIAISKALLKKILPRSRLYKTFQEIE